MEDIVNMIVAIIASFIVGMAFHSTLAHYLRNYIENRKERNNAHRIFGVTGYKAMRTKRKYRRFNAANSRSYRRERGN